MKVLSDAEVEKAKQSEVRKRIDFQGLRALVEDPRRLALTSPQDIVRGLKPLLEKLEQYEHYLEAKEFLVILIEELEEQRTCQETARIGIHHGLESFLSLAPSEDRDFGDWTHAATHFLTWLWDNRYLEIEKICLEEVLQKIYNTAIEGAIFNSSFTSLDRFLRNFEKYASWNDVPANFGIIRESVESVPAFRMGSKAQFIKLTAWPYGHFESLEEFQAG